MVRAPAATHRLPNTELPRPAKLPAPLRDKVDLFSWPFSSLQSENFQITNLSTTHTNDTSAQRFHDKKAIRRALITNMALQCPAKRIPICDLPGL
jgi:hypothetical protein